MSNLVSTAWLADHLADPDLIIFDASWHLPAAKRDAKAEFLATHIPGARFFDLDATSDQSTTLPHMLPSSEDFATAVGGLGVSNGKHVIVYDTPGLFSAARCWWMFKVFGHDSVAVLDGGLKKWLAETRATESGPTAPAQPESFTARFRSIMVRNMDQLEGAQIADARSPTRFRGEEPEPRPGVRPGHVPGAKNVHYASLLNPDSTLKPPHQLAEAFSGAGIDLTKQIVTSCGSGVTAAILTLALEQLSHHNHALYDGSWAEWGATKRDVVTGA
jgi:thiosulfate/3-mercaptopyruvate sulfurtransferase